LFQKKKLSPDWGESLRSHGSTQISPIKDYL